MFGPRPVLNVYFTTPGTPEDGAECEILAVRQEEYRCTPNHAQRIAGYDEVDIAVSLLRDVLHADRPSTSPNCEPGETWYHAEPDGGPEELSVHLVDFTEDEERAVYSAVVGQAVGH
jgi:hypothetical protein